MAEPTPDDHALTEGLKEVSRYELAGHGNGPVRV